LAPILRRPPDRGAIAGAIESWPAWQSAGAEAMLQLPGLQQSQLSHQGGAVRAPGSVYWIAALLILFASLSILSAFSTTPNDSTFSLDLSSSS
jgi:hypothetical protein